MQRVGGCEDPLERAGWGGRVEGERERGWIARTLRRLGFSWPLWAAETLGSREAFGDGESERDSPPSPRHPQPPPPHTLVLPGHFCSTLTTPSWVKAITSPALRPARGSLINVPGRRAAGWARGLGGGDGGGAEASGTPDPAAGAGRGHPFVPRGLGRRAGKRRLLAALEAFKKVVGDESRGPGSFVNPLPPLSPNALRQAGEGFPPVSLPCTVFRVQLHCGILHLVTFGKVWLAPGGHIPGSRIMGLCPSLARGRGPGSLHSRSSGSAPAQGRPHR